MDNQQKPLSLKKNSIWNVAGSIIYGLTQWGVLVVIAKLGNPEMIGIFTLGLALTAPLVLLMRFNLRSAVASDSNEEFHFNDYFSFRIVTSIMFLVIMLPIALLYSSDINTILVIIVLSIAKAIESISDILHGQMQKHERLDLTAKSRILKGILSLGIFSLILFITNNLLFSTFGFMFSWLFILIVYDLKKAKRFGKFSFVFNKEIQVMLLKLTIPLGLAQLVASLNANVPRYFIEHFHGVESLGFYASIIYIVSSGNNIIIAISAALLPRLSKEFLMGSIKKFTKIILIFSLLILIGGIISFTIVHWYGGEILTIIYTNEYEAYADEFLLFVIVAMVMYLSKILETGLTAVRKFRIQPFINIIVLLIISIGSYLLIPSYGIVGIAYSIILGELFQLVFRGGFLYYFLTIRKKKDNIMS